MLELDAMSSGTVKTFMGTEECSDEARHDTHWVSFLSQHLV
jgi:hypothetical protein